MWSNNGDACVAVYNTEYVSRRVTNRRCIFSECTPDDGDRARFREAIHDVAREVQRQLEQVAQMAGIVVHALWNVIVALVTFMFAVLMLPFGGSHQLA